MKKVIERIVESPGAPNENDLWLNGTTLKKFENGEWKEIASGSGGEEPTPQVQSDWNQNDSTKVDYIKNKPSIPETLTFDSMLGKYDTISPILPPPGEGYTEAELFQRAKEVLLAGGTVIAHVGGYLYVRANTFAEEEPGESAAQIIFTHSNLSTYVWLDPGYDSNIIE